MTKDINVQAQQRLGEIIEARDLDRFDEVWAADVVDHDPAADQAPGIEGIRAFWSEFLAAFPDLKLEPQILTADDDSVSAVFRITGTHTGDFQGHGPTGNTFEVRGIQVAKFRDGKIVERWGSTDEKGLAEQLQLDGKQAHFVSK